MIGEYIWQKEVIPPAEQWNWAVEHCQTLGDYAAERDLEIRGPGDYFGTRQSGAPMFSIADMLRDAKIREVAKKEAHDFVASEEAESERGRALLRYVIDLWGERFGLAASG